MKKTIFLTALLVLFANSAATQAPVNVDSLKQVLEKSTDPKTKWPVLRELMFHFIVADGTTAKKYGYEMVALGQKIDDEHYLGALLRMCSTFGRLGQPDSAEIFAQHLVDVARKKSLPEFEGNGLMFLSMIADQRGDVQKSIAGYKEALPKVKKAKDSMSILINLGVANLRIKNHEAALQAFLPAEKIAKTVGDPYPEGTILTNLVEIYQSLGKTNEAIACAERALKIHQQIGYKAAVAFDYAQLGKIYVKDVPDGRAQGLEFYKKSLQAARDGQDTITLLRSLADLSKNYREDGAEEAALVYIKEGLSLVGNAAHHRDAKAAFLRDMAGIENRRSNFAAALRYAKASLDVSPPELKYLLPSIYQQLVIASKGLGDFKSAVNYQEIYSNLMDSLNQTERTKSVAEIDAKYQTAEKDKSIALLENEKLVQAAEISRRRSQLLYLSLAAIALLLGGGLLFFRNRYRQTLELEKMRSRIAADLHDEVGSSLSHLNLLVGSFDVENAPAETARNVEKSKEIMQKTASDIRDVVWAIDARRDKISDLLDRMEDFAFDILAARQIQTHFSSDGLDREAVVNPFVRQNIYLIFKEAINNIAKHSTATEVNISLKKNVKQKNAALEMEILDNGKTATATKVKGLGMESMQLRAKRIGGELTAEQSENGFSVRLTAPFDLK